MDIRQEPQAQPSAPSMETTSRPLALAAGTMATMSW